MLTVLRRCVILAFTGQTASILALHVLLCAVPKVLKIAEVDGKRSPWRRGMNGLRTKRMTKSSRKNYKAGTNHTVTITIHVM